MLTRRLEDLTLADIERLKENGITESNYLDFKSAPVGNSDRERKEFLADVTAFANAAGGDIVFGVTEKDGAAAEVPGIALPDSDKEKLRLGSLIRESTEPRLANFGMLWLPIGDDIGVLVLRVARSWVAPHRVTLQGHDKFYVRNAAGKHPMNVDELRQAFNLSQSVTERIREFRTDRVRMLLADEGPFPTPSGVKLVFHIMPLSAFVDPPDLNLSPAAAEHLRFLNRLGYSLRYTLDGYANYNDSDGPLTYTLAFRNGIIEAIAIIPVQEEKISSNRVEKLILEGWSNSLLFFRKQGIEPPLHVFATLTNMKQISSITPQSLMFEDNPVSYRRELLHLPEVVVSAEQQDTDAPTLMRPMFDTLANAFGRAKSFNYGPDGQYQNRA